MLRIENILPTTHSIDNIYDLMFMVYVGKSITEEISEEPDFSGVKLDESLVALFYNKELIEALDLAYEAGWINKTLSFYQQRLDREINTRKLKENSNAIIPYFGDLSPLGVINNYTVKDFINTSLNSISNPQYQFMYVGLIARLLVRRYMSNTGLTGTDTVFDKPITLQVRAELLYNKEGLVYFTHIINYPEVKSLIVIQDMFFIDKYTTLLYYSWGYDQLTRGLFKSKGFSVEQKHKYMIHNEFLGKDMPILYYRKADNFNSTKDSRLEMVSLGIIRNVDEKQLFIEHTHITNTRIGMVAEANQNIYTKQLNSFNLSLNSTNYNPDFEVFDIDVLGIEGYMMAGIRKNGKSKKVIKEDYLDSLFEEDIFIKQLDINNNVRMLINPSNIINIENIDEVVENRIEVVMRQTDAVYWLLKDYGVSFNEDKFLELYGDDLEYGEPLYDMEIPKLYQALKQSDINLNHISADVLSELYAKANS